MDVQELADGLWGWTAHHAEWGEDVGCVYYEGSDAVVLVDPLVPASPEAERFWGALERDLARAGRPLHVLITVFFHTRSAGEVARRHNATVWAPSRAGAAVDRRTGLAVERFRPGDTLPGGIEAHGTARTSEVVFWIAEHRALVFGDVVLGRAGGGVRLCPESWLPTGRSQAELKRSLRPLLDLAVERLLVSHGDPVPEDGGRALSAILR